MKPQLTIQRTLAPGLIALLVAACGGGGDGGSVAATYPTSGAYGWVLKASGATDALKYGLSLVHPSRTDTEFVLEPASAVVSDARLVSRGSVEPAQLRATSVQPHTLVYIVGGDVRSVPLLADGSAPKTRVQRAQSTSACRFVIEANDHAAPQNSRFVVSTAGADGQCDSSDDGRAEVRLAASGPLGYTPIAGERPLGLTRDPTTLAPRGWIFPRNVEIWSTAPATAIATRVAPALPHTTVLAAAPDAALAADGTRLSVLRFGTAAVTESLLDATITAGSTWQAIGFDADNFYAYLNSGTDFNATWKVLKVARANPSAAVLATGSGLINLANMGRDMLYLTVIGASDNKLVRIAKAAGAPVVTTSTVPTTLLTVQTGANGVHQRWRVTGVGSTSLSYSVDFVNESDTALFNVAGGFPLNMAAAGTQNFNASESRTRFIVAGNFGGRAFGDAALVGYDTVAQAATQLGTLPGSSLFGNDAVFASAAGGPDSAGLGIAARSVGGTVLENGARVFSFDLGLANSLKLTTATQ